MAATCELLTHQAANRLLESGAECTTGLLHSQEIQIQMNESPLKLPSVCQQLQLVAGTSAATLEEEELHRQQRWEGIYRSAEMKPGACWHI